MIGRFDESERNPTNSPLARFILLFALIATAAALRVVPHAWNFAPVGAMAVFGGAQFADRRIAFCFPLLTLLPGDAYMGFHILVPVVYGSFAINVLLGRWLRNRRRPIPVALITLAGSIQFFIVTNFASWILWYPHTAIGLADCYLAGLQVFHNTLIGDFLFTSILFGVTFLAEAGFPVFRERAHLTIT